MRKFVLIITVLAALAAIIPLALSAVTTGSQVPGPQLVSPVQSVWNSDLWNVGDYQGALSDADQWNQNTDTLNQVQCAQKGQPAKLEDECDKPKLSKVNAQEGGTGSQSGIEPLKDNVKEDLKKGADKGEDVCGYNQACPEAAKEFKDTYKKCITPCNQITNCPSGNPEIDPNSVNGPTGECYKTLQLCKKSDNEIKKCNKDASDAANKKGNEEIEKKQKPGDKPDGREMTANQQEHCLRKIREKGQCDEVQKVATADTIARLSTSDTGLILGLTTNCPFVAGLNCGPWDKCHKSTIAKSNCALGSSDGVDKLLPDNCGVDSGSFQLKASNYASAKKCGSEPKCG